MTSLTGTAAMAGHSDSSDELWKLSATDLLAAYADGSLTPVEVAADLLERIERLNPVLSTYLTVDPAGAMEAARSAEAVWTSHRQGTRAELPPLCGVPVSVKDTVELAGMPTTYGSLAFSNNRAPDSEIGRRLRAAGAVFPGKTNTSEFALSTYTMNRLSPPASNPWNPAHTAGGSSGGAGAAVAAGLGPIGIGTDSAGSIRLPAAYAGVLGFKPTFGAVPVIQRWRASPTRSHSGVLTRTTADARLGMEVLTGMPFPTGTGRLSLAGARVAILLDDPDHGGVLKGSIEILVEAGAEVMQASPLPVNDVPAELEPGVWTFSGDHYAAAEAICPNFWKKHSQDLTGYAYPLYEAGHRASAWRYRRALDHYEAYARAVSQWFESFDFVLTSVSPGSPEHPATLQSGGLGPRFPLLSVWNHTGHPAVSIPAGYDDAGLPLAVQVVGRHGQDPAVLEIAAHFETVRPWTAAWPTLAAIQPPTPNEVSYE